MKIALFIELYQRGGIETFLVNLVNAWPRPEDTFVLVANASYPGLRAIEMGWTRPCEVVRYDRTSNPDLAGLGGWSNAVRRVASPVTRYLRMASSVPRLRAILRETAADELMVVNGGYPGGDLCRMAGIAWRTIGGRAKSIHNFHNLATRIPWYLWIQETVVDWLLCGVTRRFVTVSSAAAASVATRPTILRAGLTSYVYNGLTVAPAPPGARHEVRADLRISQSAPVCLMLATYEPRKGHLFLLRAFRKVLEAVPEAQLIICGFGFPYEVATVEAYRRELGLEGSVHLLKFRTDVVRLLASAEVLVVASQEYESFGLTSVEAMAHRIPVVATRVGGIPEVVVDGEGGYCVERDDVDGFAERVVSLLVNQELRAAQGELGFRRYVARFGSETMARRYAELLQETPPALRHGVRLSDSTVHQ